MTRGDEPCGRPTRRRIVAIVAVLAVGLLAASGLVAAVEPVDLDCAGADGGGPVYVTDTGLEVVDDDTAAAAPFGAFPNDSTVRFAGPEYANVSVSADGPASLRLAERLDGRTCVAAVNATAHEVLIEADGDGTVGITGSVHALAFGAADFDADDEADLAYDASERFVLRVRDVPLDENETVAVESLDSDAIDDAVDVDANGTLAYEFPAGERRIAFYVDDGSGGGGGGGGGIGGGGSFSPPAPPSNEPAAFDLDAVALDADRVDVGEVVAVSATVRNVGDETGSIDLQLVVDGDPVATEAVSLDGGETTAVEFRHAFDEAGTYDVAIDDEPVGTVTVDEPADGSDAGDDGSVEEPDADSSAEGLPGFGVATAILGLLASALLVRTRAPRSS